MQGTSVWQAVQAVGSPHASPAPARCKGREGTTEQKTEHGPGAEQEGFHKQGGGAFI